SRYADLVDDDVGLGEQRIEGLIVGREGEHLLARVPRARDVLDQRIAFGWHDADDLGAEVAEHARGAGAGVVTEVEHAQPIEQPLCHASLPRKPDGGASVYAGAFSARAPRRGGA